MPGRRMHSEGKASRAGADGDGVVRLRQNRASGSFDGKFPDEYLSLDGFRPPVDASAVIDAGQRCCETLQSLPWSKGSGQITAPLELKEFECSLRRRPERCGTAGISSDSRAAGSRAGSAP